MRRRQVPEREAQPVLERALRKRSRRTARPRGARQCAAAEVHQVGHDVAVVRRLRRLRLHAPRGVPFCSTPPAPGLVALVAHETRPKGALGGVLVVGPAAKPDVLHRRLATARDRDLVIELEQRLPPSTAFRCRS
jgi:hypothetical protein